MTLPKWLHNPLLGKDGRPSFGKLVVVAILVLVGIGKPPSDVLGPALLLYSYGRMDKGAPNG